MITMVVTLLGLAAVNFLYKAAGPAVLGDRSFPPRLQPTVAALPAALLAGLVVVAVLGDGWRSFDWTVLPGLLLALALRASRRSNLTCIVAAIAATALLRLLV